MTGAIAEREKKSAALNSVLAALFLVVMKLIVGWLSGSLGILAEAAHSGLDLVAALVTFWAVRTSSKPADHVHQYGHGKVENLSALAETGLLLGTCVWIVVEAVERLSGREVRVDASVWTFAVMIISIVVDVSRSRMLYRAARKHRSQALEADALHFSTDIWSSTVVIFGLLGVRAAAWWPEATWLHKADAVSAMMVALIVVWVSLRLGIRTIHALLDAAPPGMADQLKKVVEQIDGVEDCHAIRIRSAGAQYFVDMHVLFDGALSLQAVHELTDKIEVAVGGVLPEADVTVHPEPKTSPKKSIAG